MYAPTRESFSVQEPQQPILLDQDKSKDISRYYSVENELDFLARYGSGLKPEEQFFYLAENQLRFLGEFVGHLKFSKIRFLLNGKNGFNYAGLRMIDMLKYTTDLVGDKREAYENLGLAQIYKAFENDYRDGMNKLQKAALLSPPKDWDYAYMFYYDKKYDPFLGNFVVDMYPLMYEEKRQQLDNSRRLLFHLNPSNINRYQTTEDYLTMPFIDSALTLERAISLTGISQADIQESEKFQETIERFLGPEISFYAQGIIELYSQKQTLSPSEYQKRFSFLELLRRSIFNKAEAVWKNGGVIRHENQIWPPSSHSTIDFAAMSAAAHNLDMAEVLFYGQQKSATITGGGSCPVAISNNSNSNLSDSLSNGHSIEHLISSSSLAKDSDPKKDPSLCPCGQPPAAHFHCPGENDKCKHPIIVGEGTTQCPSCGLKATCA